MNLSPTTHHIDVKKQVAFYHRITVYLCTYILKTILLVSCSHWILEWNVYIGAPLPLHSTYCLLPTFAASRLPKEWHTARSAGPVDRQEAAEAAVACPSFSFSSPFSHREGEGWQTFLLFFCQKCISTMVGERAGRESGRGEQKNKQKLSRGCHVTYGWSGQERWDRQTRFKLSWLDFLYNIGFLLFRSNAVWSWWHYFGQAFHLSRFTCFFSQCL